MIEALMLRRFIPKTEIRECRNLPTKAFRKTNPGHPIKHQFTSQIPTSQCMTCHMHPGTNMVATYLGQTWWDNESDGKFMYPADKQINPSESDKAEKLNKNPEGSSLKGLWSNAEFLTKNRNG